MYNGKSRYVQAIYIELLKKKIQSNQIKIALSLGYPNS